MPAVKIDDHEYPLDGLGKLSLFDALNVKRQTGMSVAAIEKAMEQFAAQIDDPDLSEQDQASLVFDDESVLIGLASNIWIARLKAGDLGADGKPITFEESANVPLSSIEWVTTPDDEAAAVAAAAVDPATNPL